MVVVHIMSGATGHDVTLAAALKAGQKLELSFFEAGTNVDVVEKKSSTSVYKLVR